MFIATTRDLVKNMTIDLKLFKYMGVEMAETIEGVLENRSVEGPFSGEHGEYFKIHFQVGGLKGTKLANDPDQLPQNGDEVKVDYVPSGKFNKILSIRKQGESETKKSTKPWSSIPKKYSKKETTKALSEENLAKSISDASTTPSFQLIHPTTSSSYQNKDASIITQAFMKSLLESGKYFQDKQNDMGGISTFLNTQLLEVHVKRALEIHDKIVAERQGSNN